MKRSYSDFNLSSSKRKLESTKDGNGSESDSDGEKNRIKRLGFTAHYASISPDARGNPPSNIEKQKSKATPIPKRSFTDSIIKDNTNRNTSFSDSNQTDPSLSRNSDVLRDHFRQLVQTLEGRQQIRREIEIIAARLRLATPEASQNQDSTEQHKNDKTSSDQV